MSYKVEVTREGRWWMVHIPEIDGLTQARRLSEVEPMARDYIAVWLEIPVEEVEVEVVLGDIGKIPVQARANRVRHDRQLLAEVEGDLVRESTALAKDLASEGIPVRDIGEVLGVSYQRAQQLVTA